MRCLVFGGTGMLGRAVVAAARARGFPALGLSHGQADVTDGERTAWWAAAFRPEVVINCAAFTRVDACETESGRAFAVNAEGARQVAQAAEQCGALLVHLSTDYVFDGTASVPYREDDATAPRSVYAASKLAGEAHALANPRGLVVRTSWLFGPGGPNFAAAMVGLIERGKLPLRVVDDQTGRPTYTPFLARAVLDLAALGTRGIVHYGNREPVSWYAFARQIADLWHGGVEVEPVASRDFPRPAPRPAWSVLDVTRFEELTGRQVEPWIWGLAEYLAAMRQGRN